MRMLFTASEHCGNDRIRQIVEKWTQSEITASLGRSKIHCRRETSFIERALWHIEWTIRNPQATHLESPVLRLGHVAANNYDIIVLFVVVALLSIVITWKLFIRCIATGIRKPTHLQRQNRKKIDWATAERKKNILADVSTLFLIEFEIEIEIEMK